MFLVDFHKMSDSQVAIFPNVSGKRRLVFKCFYCIKVLRIDMVTKINICKNRFAQILTVFHNVVAIFF